MGLTHVTAIVSNPADPSKKWQGLFLVDTGAVDSMVPGSALREIGMEPVTKRDYELADGTKVALSVGVGQIEFMGDIVGSSIIFGPDDCEPILGVTALESTGIMVDPKTNQLKRLPAVPLK
jgi:clan AA aspartic protease